MNRLARFASFAALFLGLLGCEQAEPGGVIDAEKPAEVAEIPASKRPETKGDAAHGRELATQFQCRRCHDGIAVEGFPMERHCAHCHQEILAGKFSEKPDSAKWRVNVAHVRDVPSLSNAGNRLKPEWIASYLQNPHDLRPRLFPTMPRLAISESDARDLAAFLTEDATLPDPVSVETASLAAGRTLMDAKECGACHTFSGVSPLPGATPLAKGEEEKREAVTLAPDLRFARDRMGAAELVRWLLKPEEVKYDSKMPQVPMTAAEARDIAAYVLLTPLEPAPTPQVFRRLPVLERRVSFEEVNERVFRVTCRHCHSDPDIGLGDGGPGNTGGFGFKARGLNFTRYETIASGLLDANGERMSVFAPLADGTPRLVASLLARHDEAGNKPRSDLRGMPLGLPALSPEEVQLVETWVAQGRPR